MHLIDSLETRTDWSKIFGVVDSLYNDKGFSSNADNFARAFGDEKIELKMGKNLFYKRKDIHATKKFKVKSFLSEKKTVEDFRQSKTFDYMMVIDLTARRVVIVEDEKARSLYQEGADGAMIELKLGDYYECDLGGLITTVEPPTCLSEAINKAIEGYLDF